MFMSPTNIFCSSETILIKDKLRYDESQYISNFLAQLNIEPSNYLRLIHSYT